MKELTDERDIEVYLRTRIEKLGGLCVKLPGDVKRGIPDRLCLLPGGRVVFVELKKPTGVLSEVQRMRHAVLRKLGFTVAVVWSKTDAADLLSNL